jgi:hypothetical protein
MTPDAADTLLSRATQQIMLIFNAGNCGEHSASTMYNCLVQCVSLTCLIDRGLEHMQKHPTADPLLEALAGHALLAGRLPARNRLQETCSTSHFTVCMSFGSPLSLQLGYSSCQSISA